MVNFRNGLKRAGSLALSAYPHYKRAKFAYKLAKSIKGMGGKRSKASVRKRKSKSRSMAPSPESYSPRHCQHFQEDPVQNDKIG